MTIDPSDYDLGELQDSPESGVRESDGGADDRRATDAGDDARIDTDSGGLLDPGVPDERDPFTRAPLDNVEDARSSVERELARLQESSGDRLERPYLESTPQTYEAERTILSWLDPMVADAGLRGTIDALGYYRSVGWLGEDAEDTLGEYARLVAERGAEHRAEPLDVRDHRRSLTYVARLALLQQ